MIRHGSSSVRFEVYQAMLKRATRLVPPGVEVCFLADRGFADTTLMRYLRDELHWHFRIRVKSNCWIHRPGKGWKQLNQYHLALGEVVLLQGVTLTKTQAIAGLHLALARDPVSGQVWMVVSDQPTTLQTFREYGERGKRRWVDAHWQRGNSYLRIGWNWLKGTVHQGWGLFPMISLWGEPDPDPAAASKKQSQKQLEREFTIQSYSFVA